MVNVVVEMFVGRFVGIAPNTGDAMAYKIYIESTGNIIVRGQSFQQEQRH